MEITYYYLGLGGILFTIGMMGVFINRKNLLTLLMSIEIMLLATNLNFAAFSHYLHDLRGQIFIMFVLAVAAAEAAVGLAIFITYFRNTGNIEVKSIDTMKG